MVAAPSGDAGNRSRNLTATPHCHVIGARAPYLCDTYRRLVFVNHPRHVDYAMAESEDGLLVTSNWLLWQTCLHRGLHCVNLDEGILGWDDAVEIANHHVRDANSWFQIDGEDVTLFQGVSLGRNLVSPVGQVYCDYRRLHRAVATLVARHGASEVVFHDCRLENGCLDAAARFAAFHDVAGEIPVRLIDRRDQLAEDDPEIPRSYGHTAADPGPSLRARLTRALTTVFEAVIGFASRVRRAMTPARPAALIVATALTSLPLLENYRRRGVVPICHGPWFPNKRRPRFVMGALARGVLLSWAPERPLGGAARREIDTMADRLRASWAGDPATGDPATGAARAIRRYVETEVLGRGRLHELAREVVYAGTILRRYRPQVVFTDSHQSSTVNIFMQAAKQMAIRTIATWHSILVYDLRQENIGANPDVPPWIDRCLTWGRFHEDWLAAVGARTDFRRIGYLAGERPRPSREDAAGGRRVLVLQYVSSYTELAAPHTNEYGCLVEMVRMLNALGDREVRIKCHPGAPKTEYYHRVIDYFGLDCTVHAEGAFVDHAEWADIVIGPPYTGAMLEAISLGRPYYIFCTPPNSVNMTYVQGCRVFETVEALRVALENGEPPGSGELLEYFTSAAEIAEPAEMAWAALEAEAGPMTAGSAAAKPGETVATH
jgi:hypothetical protein